MIRLGIPPPGYGRRRRYTFILGSRFGARARDSPVPRA
jgi:hypothetical protein